MTPEELANLEAQQGAGDALARPGTATSRANAQSGMNVFRNAKGEATARAVESTSRERGAAGPFTRTSPARIQLTKEQEARAAIAKMKIAERKPLSVEEQAAAETAGLFRAADQLRDEAGSGYRKVSYANPMHGAVEQHIGQTREAQSQIRDSQVAQYGAQLQSAKDIEAFQARVSLEDDMVQAGLQAKEINRAAQADEMMQAMKESQRLVQEAAEKFNRTPGVDPNRLWANRTAGQKFGAAILSVVGARVGAVLPGSFQAIQQSIADDIDAQKTNLGLAQQKFGALSEAFASSTQAYAAIRAGVEDERTADMVYERARLEQAEREFQWWMQKGQVAQLSAGQQEFLGQIQQAKANLDLALEQRTVNNPRQFTKVVSTMRPWERKAKLDRADKLEDLGIDIAKEAQKQGGALRLEGAKAQAEALAKAGEKDEKMLRGEGGVYREAAAYADKYGVIDGAIRQIDALLNQADIAGYTNIPLASSAATAFFEEGESGKTQAKIRALKEAIGRAQSQGAITDDEIDNFTAMIESGTIIGGEDKLRDNLQQLKDMLNAKRISGLRTRSPEAQQYILKNEQNPEWASEFVTDIGKPSVVNVHK